jgi:hypothetical protein
LWLNMLFRASCSTCFPLLLLASYKLYRVQPVPASYTTYLASSWTGCVLLSVLQDLLPSLVLPESCWLYYLLHVGCTAFFLLHVLPASWCLY